MGASASKKSRKTEGESNEGIKRSNVNKEVIKRELVFEEQTDPISKNEIDELYRYESAICKIRVETLKNGEKKVNFGTGFFCEIHDKNIPFNKALFTNNHVLNENIIEVNKQIEFEYCEKKKQLKLQKIERYLQIKNLIIHV